MQRWIPPRPDLGGDEWPRPPAFPAAPPPPPARGSRRSRWTAAIVAGLVAAGLVGSAASLGTGRRWPTPQASSGPRYTFIETKMSGEPVRWNPCEPIHYVVNAERAPYPEAVEDTQEAARRVTEATGIELVFDGETTEVVAQGRSAYQPGRYGDVWAPVLVAWTDPDESPIAFERDDHVALGVASPMVPTHGRFDMFVSGWVALNANHPGPGGFDTPSAVGLTIQHELGHVLGMGHTKVYGELMHDAGGGALDWGSGDLEGLRELGVGAGCITAPDAAPR